MTANRIAVSVFVAENADGTVSIRSLAADDEISKAIERMTTEQITHLMQYLRAGIVAQETVSKLREGTP